MWTVSLPVQVGIVRADSSLLPAAIGRIFCAIGIIFESVGDYQLARFKANPANSGSVMNQGLWRYTRHPNYFGDFLVWLGFYLLAAESGSWRWTIIGPLLMSLLLIRVSGVRLLEDLLRSRVAGYAKNRFQKGSLDNRITLLKEDYRDLHGKYDKLVSVEMIEVVGEKYLPGYFAKCSELLHSDGMMLLQAITIPDHRYDGYRRSVDFIQRYVFPGGFLPSMGKIGDCLRRVTDFRFFHAEDFGPHYARTLAHWRHNFWENIAQVRGLDFDERFIRIWHYYLCYCEAAFQERQTGVSQMLLTKPACRRQPVFEPTANGSAM